METKEIKRGDIFSEVSHYVALEDYSGKGEPIKLAHLESKKSC